MYYDDTIYTNGLFYILVKTNENIKKIKDIFSYSHFFGFGPRHSVGKNSFKLISIEEIKRKLIQGQNIRKDTLIKRTNMIHDRLQYRKV